MGVVSFLGLVGLSAAVAVVVRRYQPFVVGQLARQTGVDGRVGWVAFLATAVWAPLPLLAGAETDGAAWAVGDGAVRVRASDPRVVSNAEGLSTVASDEELPGPVASFLRRHDNLPDPDDRAHTLRFLETCLATDDPVTVAGTPRRGEEPRTAVVDGEDGEVVLARGGADGTERQPYRRVYCPGAAGLAWFSADGFRGSCRPGRRCRSVPRAVPPMGHRTSTPQSRNSPR